LSSRLQ
jgi:hypothetical protein